jgi:hypothetical protein
MSCDCRLFERLSLSDAVNCQHSMSHLTAVSLAQRSALWALYGRRELCSLYSQLVLHLNMRERGVCHAGEPECMALCQLATLCAEQVCGIVLVEYFMNVLT